MRVSLFNFRAKMINYKLPYIFLYIKKKTFESFVI